MPCGRRGIFSDDRRICAVSGVRLPGVGKYRRENFYPGIESGARLCGFVAITAGPLNIPFRLMCIQMLTKIVAQDYKAWRSNANAFSAAVKAEMQGAVKFGVCAIETTTAQVRSSEVAERQGARAVSFAICADLSCRGSCV